MERGSVSLAASMSSLPAEQRSRLLADLTDDEAEDLLWDWRFWARPEQLPPPGDWRTWLIMAGRGFGKTRSGAEWVRDQVEGGRCGRVALVAATAADARDVMVKGESGILAISPPWFRPVYEPSKRLLTWPNGAIATTYSAEEPDRLRGPQHDGAWCDEIAAWKYPDAWTNMALGLRLGRDPRVVATTTPRPVRLVRDLLKAASTRISRGSTYDNAGNLAPAFLEEVLSKYEGTRLGRQELAGELLEDTPGALWTRQRIDDLRVPAAPELLRVVVAIDPAVTSAEGSDETGIIAAGVGVDRHAYILADRSCRMSPDGWARRAVVAYHELQGDRIVGEVNNGGEMVELTIRTVDQTVPYTPVHASRGKRVRAEPVAALYEQGRVHHLPGLTDLEDQMVTWSPDGGEGSPDRVDALVWALSELMLDGVPVPLRQAAMREPPKSVASGAKSAFSGPARTPRRW